MTHRGRRHEPCRYHARSLRWRRPIKTKRIIIGLSGASGVIYGIRTLMHLREVDGVETHLVMSEGGAVNIRIETAYDVDQVKALADVVHRPDNLASALSSGSFRTDGMVIAPCSMKTLSAIAHSTADSLLARAADVVLKEQRRLVLMPREAPLHVGHCKLLYEAAQLGAVIAPPMPAFYSQPQTIDDLINHSVGRVLDLFGLDAGIIRRWEGPPGQPDRSTANKEPDESRPPYKVISTE